MLRDQVLGVRKSEKDLGVIMQSDLKMDKKCSEATHEVNKRLGMIYRNFRCQAWNEILRLYKMYKSIVRLHLDYCE